MTRDAQPRRARARFIAAMLAPASVLLLGLTTVPFVSSLGLSFTDYDLTQPGRLHFVGLANYARLFASEEFWAAARVTALFTVLAVSVQLVLGVGIAALLQHETRAAPVLRTAYLLPMAVTPVAAVFTFRMLLNPSLGAFNAILRTLGLPAQDWLGTPEFALLSLLLVDTWQWTPFMLLIAAGGLAAMDEEPLEAASVDGAGPFAIFFRLTLPLLVPYLAVALVFRAIDAFKTFDIIFVLTGGGPGIATRTLNLQAYKQGIEFLSMGYAGAIAIVMLIVTTVFSQLLLRRVALFRPKAAL